MKKIKIYESNDGGKTYTSRPMRDKLSHNSSNNSEAKLPNHMTSIEWLTKELYTEMNLSGDGRVLDEILEEAKQKHKEEIVNTFKHAQALMMLDPTKRAEQYYYELYEKDKQ